MEFIKPMDTRFKNQGRLNIRNNEEIDDFIILQAMTLLQKQYPNFTTQNPSLAFSTVYSYCANHTYWSTSLGFTFIHVFKNCNIRQPKFTTN